VPSENVPFLCGYPPPSSQTFFALEGVGIPFSPKAASQDAPESIFLDQPIVCDPPSSSPLEKNPALACPLPKRFPIGVNRVEPRLHRPSCRHWQPWPCSSSFSSPVGALEAGLTRAGRSAGPDNRCANCHRAPASPQRAP